MWQNRHGDTFISRYVFPDGELSTLGATVSVLEESGWEVLSVQALRPHYAKTLRAWVARLEQAWAQAVRLTSQGRARVWQLYMAGSALSFEDGTLGVNQILATRHAYPRHPSNRATIVQSSPPWLPSRG